MFRSEGFFSNRNHIGRAVARIDNICVHPIRPRDGTIDNSGRLYSYSRAINNMYLYEWSAPLHTLMALVRAYISNDLDAVRYAPLVYNPHRSLLRSTTHKIIVQDNCTALGYSKSHRYIPPIYAISAIDNAQLYHTRTSIHYPSIIVPPQQ